MVLIWATKNKITNTKSEILYQTDFRMIIGVSKVIGGQRIQWPKDREYNGQKTENTMAKRQRIQ
jgi:hypothetical protein